jgi:hypothetical protein
VILHRLARQGHAKTIGRNSYVIKEEET